MKRFFYVLIFCCVCFPFLVGAEESATPAAPTTPAVTNNPAEPLYFMCKNGAAVRTIRIQKKTGSCKTFYTKEGVDSMVGKSYRAEVCDDVANRIKTNLEKGDWKCRDISHSRVSSSME